MDKRNGFVKLNYNLGQVILKGVALQLLFILYSLRGLIIFGFFPALFTSFKIVYEELLHYYDKERKELYFSDYQSMYRTFFKKYFTETNKLGWMILIVGLFFLLDFKMSETFIQSSIFHLLLLILFSLYLGVSLYVFPVFSRYEMKTFHYFKQAFFILISNIINMIAIVIGLILITLIFTIFPVLSLVMGVPLLIFPISWFSLQAFMRIEEANMAE